MPRPNRSSFWASIFDVLLGVVGGAAGAYVADHFLDRLFGRSRMDSNRRRVR